MDQNIQSKQREKEEQGVQKALKQTPPMSPKMAQTMKENTRTVGVRKQKEYPPPRGGGGQTHESREESTKYIILF